MLPLATVQEAFSLLVHVLNVSATETALGVGPRLLSLCFAHSYSVEDPGHVVHICRGLQKNTVFAQLCLPLLVKYVVYEWHGKVCQ